MPELPEIETTRYGIEPHVLGQRVGTVIVRESRLRWPVPASLSRDLTGQCFLATQRRGKYLLLSCSQGTIILHLGMSGSLRVVSTGAPPGKHDHIDIVLSNGRCLRFNDPRRFGAMLWTKKDPSGHRLLKSLGPEPLDPAFNGLHLFQRAQNRRTPVKAFIMNSQIVVGIGNIYANEALFQARIHPRRLAGHIRLTHYEHLAEAIKAVLYEALRAGGTTLRNFLDSEGKPGYFARQLQVYGRTDHPCPVCGDPIRLDRIGQRASFYCAHCQH